MISALIKHLGRYVSLSPEEADFLEKNVPVRRVKKNEFLLKEGDVSDSFYFVIEGCIRLFYLNDIEEKTAFFYSENDFVSSYESFTRQIPSGHSFQAMEDSVVAVISTKTASDLLSFSGKFQQLAIIMMEEELITCQEIISSFVKHNAEQRYLELMDKKPDLIQRIPQHHLATFLGVTPETLSRIRKRIASK